MLEEAEPQGGPVIGGPDPGGETQQLETRDEAEHSELREDLEKTYLSQGEEPTFFDRVWRSIAVEPEEERAKAANALALSEELNIPPSVAYEHHDVLSREVGLRGQPTNREFMEGMMTMAVTGGLITHPVATILGVSGFMALGEMESYVVSRVKGREYVPGEQLGLAELAPEETSRTAATLLDIVDLVGKGAILGAGVRGGKRLEGHIKEKFLRDVITEYRLPEKVYISPQKVREFFTLDETITPDEIDALKSLDLSGREYREALKYGIDIELPAEKLTRIADRPWFRRIKNLIRLDPYEEISIERAGEAAGRKHIAGLLEEGHAIPGWTDTAYLAEADRLGITLKEFGTRRDETRFPIFIDPESGETFALPQDKTIEETLKEIRAIAREHPREGVEHPEPEPVREKPDPLAEIAAMHREPPDIASVIPLEEEIPPYETIKSEASRRAYEQFLKSRERQERRSTRELRATARSAVDAIPVYAAMDDAIKRGGIKLSSMSDYDSHTVKELVTKRPGLIAKKGTVAIDELADEYGYEYSDDLVNEMLDAPSKEAAVAKHSDEFLDYYYEQFKADDADLYAQLIDEEYKILANLTKKYRPKPARGLKKVIREQTGQVPLSGLVKEHDALKAGLLKAERAARDAYRAGKIDGAMEAKETQREMAFLLREKQRSRTRASDLRRKIVRIMKRKNIPPEYREKIQDHLAEYDLMPMSERSRQRLESRRGFLERMEAAGEAVDIPRAKLEEIERLGKVHWRELTVDELQSLYDYAAMIAHLGKIKNRIIKENQQRSFDRVVETLVEKIMDQPRKDLDAEGYVRAPSERKLSWIGSMSRSAREYHAELVKPEFIARALDGYEDMGPNWTELFKPMVEAEEAEIKAGEAVLEHLKAAFKPLGGYTWANKRYRIPGVPQMLTKEEMIMVALNSGNEGNVNALKAGYRWTDAQIDAIVTALSPEERTLVNTVWDIIEGLWPDLARAHRILTGTVPPKVPGKYFPLVFDRELSWRADRNAAEAEARDFFRTVYARPKPEAGFTVSRVGGKMAPMLSFNVIFKHVTDVIHYAHHAVPVRNVYKIVADPRFRTAVTETLGEEIYRQFVPWIQEIAKPRREPLSKIEKWARRLRRNATTVALGLKVTVAEVQTLSLTQTIDELGLVPVLSAMSKFYVNPWKAKAFVDELSVEIEQRGRRWDRELRDLYGRFNPAEFKGSTAAKDAFFAMIRFMDSVATYPSWIAAYTEGLKRWPENQRKAIEYADMVVRRTQPVASPKDLAEIQRGGELKKSLTMFYTFFSVFENRMQELHRRYRMKDISTVELLKSYWWMMIVPAIVADVIRERRIPEPTEAAGRVLSYRFAGKPFIRDIVGAIVTDYDYQFSPVVRAVEVQTRLAKELAKIPTGDMEARRLARYGIETAGYWWGLPSAQVTITLDGILDLAEGQTEKPSRLLFRERR
jgi:hypothetical protein